MRDGRLEHRVQIFRNDLAAAGEPRGDPRRAQQHAHAARTCSRPHEAGRVHALDLQVDLGRVPGRGPEIEGIALQRRGRVHRGLDAGGGLVQLSKRHRIRLHLRDQRCGVVIAGVGHERAQQLRVGRHLHRDLHEEAVAHRGRDLERLLAFDPIPVGEDLQVGKAMLGVEGAHAAFGHRAQHERVDLRPGAVDLVEEEHGEVGPVPEQRPGLHPRLTVPSEPGIVEKVARHEIDGAFDPLERAADSAGEDLEEGRLSHPHVPLQQDMSAREGGDQQQTDGPFLTDHDLVGTRFEPQRSLAPRFDVVHRFSRRFADGSRLRPVRSPYRRHLPRSPWTREP